MTSTIENSMYASRNVGANATQHGGDHYKAEYEHWDWAVDMELDYFAAAATKYVTRHRKKNGREDVLKSKHYIEKKIELTLDGRIPPPCRKTLHIDNARYAMLIRFCRANGSISERTAEFGFLASVSMAESVDDLENALVHADAILTRDYAPKISKAERECRHTEETTPAPVPSNVAALLERDRFSVEGWLGGTQVAWKCKACRTYFTCAEGALPSSAHTCSDGSEADHSYIDQG
jgi:Protein of unknwon function (DUF3310)